MATTARIAESMSSMGKMLLKANSRLIRGRNTMIVIAKMRGATTITIPWSAQAAPPMESS